MAKLKTRETPEYWLTQVDLADQQRSKAEDKFEWEKLKKLWNDGAQSVTLELESNTQGGVGSSAGFVNWVYAFCQVFMPAVYWRHPEIHVYPSQPAYEGMAPLVESCVNAAFRQTGFRHQCRRVLQDVLVFGHGWMKMGWFTRLGQVPPLTPSSTNDRSKVSQEVYLKQDEPYSYRVDPSRIYVDPNARTYEEANWIAQEHIWDIEYVQSDPFLEHTKNLQATLLDRDQRFKPDLEPLSTAQDTKRWIKAYEIWDRESNQVFIHCAGSPKWNKKMTWPYPDIKGFPFKFLAVSEAIDQFYPPSIVLPWLPLVEELSQIRAMRLDHLRMAPNKIIVESQAVDADQKQSLLDPNQEITEVTDSKGIIQFNGLRVDPNMYASEERVEANIREISGFSEVLSGSMPFSRMSATGAAVMERNSTVRFEYYSERVADFVQTCAQCMYKILRDYQPDGVTVQIAGQPDPKWIKIGSKELHGEYFFHIDVEDMAISSRQQKIKNNFDALTAVGEFPEVQRTELIKDLLTAFGKTDLGRYMKPPEGPAMDPYYENTLILQGRPIQPTSNEEHALHLEIHQRFTQDPVFLQAARQQPAIAAIMSEHIQITMKMLQAEQTQMGTQMKRSVSGAQSMQQGQANATSQPVGRGQGAALSQMMQQAVGGGGA